MRQLVGPALVVVSLFVLTICTPVFAAEAGANALDAAWTNAMKANNLAAVTALYAPDAVMWLPETPEARGTAAIRSTYEGLFKAFTVRGVTMADTHVQTAGNASSSWGRYTLTREPKKGGKPVTMSGRFTGVAEKRGDHWLYVADHASAEPPPAVGVASPAAKKK